MTSVVNEVVDAVADVDGIDPVEIDPIYEYIDPEILEKLAEQDKKSGWKFTFQYSDHQITLTSNGQILVDGVARTTDIRTQ